MRSIRALSALMGAALALGHGAGCGGGREEPADLAKLEPPAASAAGGKAVTKPMPPPKFGSPPKTSNPQP